MNNRRSWPLALVLFSATATAQPLTLDQALQAVDGDSLAVEADQQAVQAVAAQADAAGRWSGPTVTAATEQVADQSEWDVILSQPVSLVGRQAADAEVLQARAAALKAQQGVSRADRKHAVALLFSQALYRQTQHQTLQIRAAQLREAEAAIRRRVQEGDAAQFDLDWVERERRNADRNAAIEALEAQRLRGELAAALGLDQVEPQPTKPPECDVALQPTPEQEAARLQDLALQRDAERAQKDVLPDLEVEAGWKMVDATTTEHGFTAALALNFPFWSAADAVDAVQAERVALQTQLRLTQRRQAAQIKTLQTTCQTWKTLVADAEAAVTHTRTLSERARNGFVAGEVSLLEWLNAEHAVVEDELATAQARHELEKTSFDIKRLSGAWK